MNIGDNFPARPHKGRLSDGWTHWDWSQLSHAVDMWNESGDDPDVQAVAAEIFMAYDCWDNVNNEPNLAYVRRLYMERC